MDTVFDKSIVIDSGLNVKLCNGIHLLDYLTVEYGEELNMDVGIFYLKHISRNSNYFIQEGLTEKLPDFCIVFLPGWSVFIKSKYFYQGILICPLRAANDLCLPHQTLILNQTEMISYKVIGLVALLLSLKTPVLFIEAFKTIKYRELAFKTIQSLKSFIFSVSKIPHKTLQLDINEAKDLIRSNIIKPQQIQIAVKPIVDIWLKSLVSCKPITAKLYDINESSESLEYSPTQEVSERTKHRTPTPISEYKLLPTLVEMDNEEHTHVKSLQELNEVLNIGLHSTPLNSPRQAKYSIIEVKQIMSFNSTEFDTPPLNSDPIQRVDAKESSACSSCMIF